MRRVVYGMLFCLMLSQAQAELVVEITSGNDSPTPIAIVPMSWSGPGTLTEDLSAIVSDDLRRSGQFFSIPRSDMLSLPSREVDVHYRDWRLLDARYLVIGRISQVQADRYHVEFDLFDIFSQRKLLTEAAQGSSAQLRMLAHYVSDKVYESITGIRGIFSTQIAYVEQIGEVFYLKVADADGARARTIFRSRPGEPILSPDWSPDAKWLTYVSFETTRPAIYLHEIATGQRQQLTSFQGLNGAPTFSPDGRKIAFTLSKDGDPDIYVMDLASEDIDRIVSYPIAIDTEPNWSNDGESLVFTSNRGGSPQIYQLTLANRRVERLTFDGSYNAGAVVSHDGTSFVYVHQAEDGDFYIAHQNIATGDIRLLTRTNRREISLDESPAIAPNGALLMYATKYRGKGILAAVSADIGGTSYNLPSTEGDVREPAWSPYLN